VHKHKKLPTSKGGNTAEGDAPLHLSQPQIIHNMHFCF